MSRIQEALLKAEAQASRQRAADEVKPIGASGWDDGAPWQPGEILAPTSLGDPFPSSGLRIDELQRRSAKPGWRFSPDAHFFAGRDLRARAAAEQFRTLRSRLERIRESVPMRTLVITSTVPGEGKTVVALNLARAVVQQSGRRALLIDGDMRASKLHFLMNAPYGPGLAEYLAGEADVCKVMQSDPPDSLFFIPAGTPASNAAELLANKRFKGLLDHVAPLFDWVIVDAPPVLPVSDARVLATLCDGVIFVVRAGETDAELAQSAWRELKETNLIGVVLNSTDDIQPYGYSYYGGSDRSLLRQ